jgi:hypothetical protein
MTFHIRVFAWVGQSLLDALKHYILPGVLHREPVLSLPEVFLLVSKFGEEIGCHVGGFKVNFVSVVNRLLNPLGHISRLIAHYGAILDAMVPLSQEVLSRHIILSIELMLEDSFLV